MTDDLLSLKNIGLVTAEWLHEVGIHTRADLQSVGPVLVWQKLKAIYPHKVSLVLLYALEGALADLHWNQLPPEVKAELRAQVWEL